jgi:hypothetical protein
MSYILQRPLYVFRAYRFGAINISGSGNLQPLIFNTEDFDIGSAYNNSTGVWTVPELGIYHVGACVQFSSLVDAELRLQKNGSGAYLISTATPSMSSSTADSNSINVTVKAVSGDTFEVDIFNNDTGGALVAGGSTNTYFYAFKVNG